MENYKNLQSSLKNHSDLNKKIETLNKTLGEMRKQRNSLEDKIMIEMKRLELENKKIRIENAHYFVSDSKSTPSLNLGLIEKVGNKYLGEQNTKKFIEKIKEYRETNG